MDEIIKKKIEFEISQLDEHLSKSLILIRKCSVREPDYVELCAAGSILADYMNFRHFFRHSYGYSMKWEKLSHLFLNLENNWNEIKKELSIFLS